MRHFVAREPVRDLAGHPLVKLGISGQAAHAANLLGGACARVDIPKPASGCGDKAKHVMMVIHIHIMGGGNLAIRIGVIRAVRMVGGHRRNRRDCF